MAVILVVLPIMAGVVFGVIFLIKGIKAFMKNIFGQGIGFTIIAVVCFLAAWIVWAKVIPWLQQL